MTQRTLFDDIPRIASPSFQPSVLDIARGCSNSAEVIRDKYCMCDGTEFNLHHATGLYAERQRWIGCFNQVDCVAFVIDLSSYNEYNMSKKGRPNRLAESFEVIHSICSRTSFADKPVILILNKVDQFSKKILHCDIADQAPFNDYKGPTRHAKKGCRYFVQKFKYYLAKHNVDDVFIHTACTAETEDVLSFIVYAVSTIKMMRMLRSSGFLGFDPDSPLLLEDICLDKDKLRPTAASKWPNHWKKKWKIFPVLKLLSELMFGCMSNRARQEVNTSNILYLGKLSEIVS